MPNIFTISFYKTNNYMKKRIYYLGVLPALFAAGSLALTGCTNSDYDLGDLDKTIAIGSKTLELPSGNSVKEILLDDILDLDGSESVTIEENGLYQFKQSSSIDDVNDIKVETITMTPDAPDPYSVDIADLSVSALPTGVPDAAIDAAFDVAWDGIPTILKSEGRISLFTFNTDLDENVKWLKTVTTKTDGNKSRIKINLSLSSNINQFVKQVSTMTVKLPTFLDLTVTDQNGNKVVPSADGKYTLSNIPSTGADITVTINGLKDFKEAKAPTDIDYLLIQKKAGQQKLEMLMQGEAYTEMIIDRDADIAKEDLKTALKTGAVSGGQLNAITAISDIIISGAEGKFAPDIDIEDSRVELDDMPDFLTDKNVVVDLYNPQIILNAESKLPLNGFINATLIAKMKDGTVVKTLPIPQFTIKKGTNKICITRRDENIPSGTTQTVIVPNLSEIINKVPDYIDLKITANADENNDYTIKLGESYSLTDIDYNIQAPLSFGEKAKIVYNEYEDGWAEDMPEDMDFEKGAYIEVTGIVESNVPTYLKFTAKAVNTSKTEIDNVTVDVDNIIGASTDGKTSVQTPIKIIIREKEGVKGALKDVDGIHYSLEAASAVEGKAAIVGKALNANENKLSIKDIKVTIHGRLIADLN